MSLFSLLADMAGGSVVWGADFSFTIFNVLLYFTCRLYNLSQAFCEQVCYFLFVMLLFIFLFFFLFLLLITISPTFSHFLNISSLLLLLLLLFVICYITCNVSPSAHPLPCPIPCFLAVPPYHLTVVLVFVFVLTFP